MAKKEEKSVDETIYALMSEVGCGRLSALVASTTLREYVRGLSESEQEEFKKKCQSRAGTIMQVAELFKQELTVIGAGQ